MTRMSASPTSIKIILAKSLFDILMVHENAMFKNDVNSVGVLTTNAIQQALIRCSWKVLQLS